MNLDKRVKLSMQYSQKHAKALCTCGHTGAGENSDHAGFHGHGFCTACACAKFTWKGWTKEYQAFMRRKGFAVR